MTAKTKQLTVRVRRRDRPEGAARWEQLVVEREPGMTVADVLEAINRAPRLTDGQPTTPIAWASACTWPACGVCTMLINGRAAPACGTTVDAVVPKRGKLRLEPMSSYPVRRDLWVDRSRIAQDAARVNAYIDEETAVIPPLDTTLFSACTRCGACIEACPEAHLGTSFIGPYAIGAVNATQLTRGKVPSELYGRGGIADCGHVQNCVETCPERIPLDRAVRAAAKGGFKAWLGGLFSPSRQASKDD